MATSWRVGGFDVEVLCDDQPITIRELNGVSYAVIPNTASYFECEEWETDPWGEPFSQDYRYTPFQVKATDSESRCTQISLHLDGSKAGGKIMTQRHNSHVFKGFDTKEGVTQFCFSPPRVGNAHNKTEMKPVNMELGTIRFEVKCAHFSHVETNRVSSSRYTDFKDSTKKDAKNAGIDPTKGFMAIKKGRVIEKREPSGGYSSKGGSTSSIYDVGAVVEVGKLRYVTEYAMGILEGRDQESVDDGDAVATVDAPQQQGSLMRAVADFAKSVLPGGGKRKEGEVEGEGGDTGAGGEEKKAKRERMSLPMSGEIEDL